MNTEPRENEKNYFEKDFLKFMGNLVFVNNMKNIWKHRAIKLITNDERKNKLVSTKQFSENLITIEMAKTKFKMKKLVYLG